MKGEFEIDFEWEVADRYELRPATIKKVSKEDRERQSREHRERLRQLFNDDEEFEKRERRWAAERAKEDPREHWLYGIPESELPLYHGTVAVAGKLKKYRIKSENLEKAVKLLVAGLDRGRKTPFYTIALKVSQAIGVERSDTGDPVRAWYSIAESVGFIVDGR